MTVIASKIAHAAQIVPDRPDSDRITDPIVSELLSTLAPWLSTDLLKLHSIKVGWTHDVAKDLPPHAISAKGDTSTSRVTLALSDHFAQLSACRLLNLPENLDAATLATLKPFVDQNLSELGPRVAAGTKFRDTLRDDSVWTIETAETLASLYRDIEVVRIDLSCGEVGAQPSDIVLMTTPDLLGLSDDSEDDTDIEEDETKLSPRLGPCEVEIKAVADRVRMSVADCSRLQIGQIVALPGLRFDQLELNIAMNDGPVPLVDAALGADKGRKAVRINRSLDPDFRLPPSTPAANAAAKHRTPA